MTAKELVKAFYESDLANDATIVPRFFHKDCKMHWNSSHGFRLLNYNDIEDFFENTRKSYHNIRFEFTHLIETDALVTSRHTLFANTIEDPNFEQPLAHYSTIWEVKDNKLYRGYEISQQANETDLECMNSYAERKI